MQENYLAKWLNNELTEEELATFKKSDEFASYQKIISTTERLKAPDFDVENALAESKLKKKAQSSKLIKLSPIKKWMRIAAAIALLLTGSYFYFNSQNEIITTAIAENTLILLPDNSEVVLNAVSEIKYSKKNWVNKRTLKLSGEAFFKVAKGQQFTVETAQGLVQVLGTKFNVKSTENFFEVTCFEGLVSVQFKDETTKLPSGFSFVVIDNKFTAMGIPDTLEPTWLRKESAFKGIPLRFVLAELERQFNITIDTKNIDTNTLFTGSFSHNDLELALRSICEPNQIKFTIAENNVSLYAENTP